VRERRERERGRERGEWDKWAYIIKSSAKLSQQINQIMAQNPLLPNAVEPLSASLDVHHFPVAHLHLHHTQKLIKYRSLTRHTATIKENPHIQREQIIRLRYLLHAPPRTFLHICMHRSVHKFHHPHTVMQLITVRKKEDELRE